MDDLIKYFSKEELYIFENIIKKAIFKEQKTVEFKTNDLYNLIHIALDSIDKIKELEDEIENKTSLVFVFFWNFVHQKRFCFLPKAGLFE